MPLLSEAADSSLTRRLARRRPRRLYMYVPRDADDVLPLFKQSESYEYGSDEYHGSVGGLNVSKIRAKSQISEAFIGAAVEMGVPRSNDFNRLEQEGVGYFDQTAKNGIRCSASNAFLQPIINRSNLDIKTNAITTNLLFNEGEKKVVNGVRFKIKNNVQYATLKAGGEVILSAGTIG